MSAAAARRRKQLAKRKEEQGQDSVSLRLQELLQSDDLAQEETAYEALQLAQSQVRKRIKTAEYDDATEVAYNASMAILKRGRVSVASQLLAVLAEVLRETHTDVSDQWIERITEIHTAHQTALEADTEISIEERNRLERLEKEFLRKCVQWTSDLGTVRYGNMKIQELLGHQSWKLSFLVDEEGDDVANKLEEEDPNMALKCDAVTHMALAEKPEQIKLWLKELPPPTADEVKMGHQCLPCDRDALLTRALILFIAIDNLRDANELLRGYISDVEERNYDELKASYMNKEDGKAPAHVVFGAMLLRVCEKDTRTGPLFSWLLRSFKKELDMLYKPQVIQSYTTKIGKNYFHIQPPPSMMSMMENVMGMMGGGGAGGMPGGLNPAMMQAALAQAQGLGGR